MGRRLCIFGFCRSVEMLSDVVEDIVLEQGGEVCYKSICTVSAPALDLDPYQRFLRGEFV